MAWYYGTYSCGHEGRVNIIGPTKDREWKKEREFEKMCPECYEKYLEEKREKANTLAAEKAKEMELPTLEGTEKQVAWANTLRQEFINKFDSIKDKKDIQHQARLYYFEEFKEIQKQYGKEYINKIVSIEGIQMIKNYILTNYVNATYFIGNKGKRVLFFLLAERENVFKTDTEIIQEKQEKEVKLESTVYPENKITNVAVEINYSNDKITAKFEKNEDFRAIVKDLGYKWNGSEWERKISYKTGLAEDRVAELGNKLLNKGFPITILNEKVRKKAINGEYEQECTRWISKRSTGDYKGRLSINWSGMNDSLYNTARKLPGSRWDKGVIIRVEHYKEVEEFARLYSFKFSPGATEMIGEYKEELNKAEKVTPAEVKEIEKPKDGLEEILKSNSDILDDLRED